MKVILNDVRLAFPNVFEARAAEGSTKEKFGATFLYEEGDDNHELLKQACEAVLVEKHGDKAGVIFKKYNGAGRIWLFRDGDDKADQYAGFEGMMYLGANSERRPKLRAADGVTPIDASDGILYAGCYVRAIIDVYEYKPKGGGVTAELLGIQFMRDGERLSGGGVASDDDFEPVAEATQEAAATGKGAGSIFD